jgi:hypothetical protein
VPNAYVLAIASLAAAGGRLGDLPAAVILLISVTAVERRPGIAGRGGFDVFGPAASVTGLAALMTAIAGGVIDVGPTAD